MRCSFCGGDEVVYSYSFGLSLCEKCLVEYVERKVLSVVRGYRLIEKRDHVAAALSGGKDSTTLILILSKLREVLDFELTPVIVDEGIAGYRDLLLKHAVGISRRLGLKPEVIKFDEVFGFPLDEVVEVGRGMGYAPCTICGVLRRYAINRGAREIGADKLATGHNLDDEIQTFVMNVIHGHITNIARSGLAMDVIRRRRLVARIKPLFFNEDRENAVYSFIKGVYPPVAECPYAPMSARYEYRRFVNRLEARWMGTKMRILRSMLLLKYSTLRLAKTYNPKPCKVCGEPTSRSICKACEIREKLAREIRN